MFPLFVCSHPSFLFVLSIPLLSSPCFLSSALLQDNFGFDLQAVEAATKKHEAIETDIAAYEERVQVGHHWVFGEHLCSGCSIHVGLNNKCFSLDLDPDDLVD